MAADVLNASPDDDLLVPVGLAVGLHALLVVVLLLAGWLQPAPQRLSVAGPVVEATLMLSESDLAAAERAMAEPPPEPAAPPRPEPRPQEAPPPAQPAPQAPVQEPDTVDQEEVARLALRQAEEERRLQEARVRQEQIDLTERERQQEAERRRQERARELAELQRQREEAARRTRMEEQRLRQLADRATPAATPAETPAEARPAGGNEGADTDLRARYALAIQQAIERNWNRPETISPGAACPLRIIQSRGGNVISVEVLPGCRYDALGQRSVEAAVLKAEPLPYAGFESVFTRDLRLNFRATEN